MPIPSDTAVRDLAREILSRAEYEHARPPAWDARALLEWLSTLGQWLTDLRVSTPLLYWTLLGGLLVLTLLSVAHVLWSVMRALRTSAPDVATPVATPGRNLVAEAEALALAGRHLEGAHRLLLATLHLVARASVIDLRPEHTNRAVRERLTRSQLPAELGTELAALIDRTERNWFHDRTDDPTVYADWHRVFHRLQRTVGTPA